MNSENIDLLLDGLKLIGLAITGVTGLVGVFAIKTWDEYTVEPRILAAGHVGEKKRRLTKSGWMSLIMILLGGVVAIGAQCVESSRTRQKERVEAREKKEQQAAHQQEIARIQREYQDEMAKRLEGERVHLAKLFFQGRELDTQRASFLEQAQRIGLEVQIPKQSNSFSVSNLSAEIRKAVQSLPDELRAASEAKNKVEGERIATETKAKELDKAIRPHINAAIDLIQNVLALAMQDNLVTVTSIGLIPKLPERMVFSRQEQNYNHLHFGPDVEPFGTNYQQRIDFAHGETWVVSFLPAFIESTSHTNDRFFPKISITRRPPLPTMLGSSVAIISFEPASAEIRINSSKESDTALKPEDRVAKALVDALTKSILKGN